LLIGKRRWWLGERRLRGRTNELREVMCWRAVRIGLEDGLHAIVEGPQGGIDLKDASCLLSD
jgi:hypothetical protein